MKQTKNFFLKLFEGADKFDYKVINENWQKVDDAINELLNGGNVAVLPSMTIEKIEGGYHITTNDAKGSYSFDIINGKTAYQYAKDGGYTGTEEEFTTEIAKSGEVGQEINRLSMEVETERARINNLTRLKDGSTTGDAELQDIRVGHDGFVYDNAGDAVRTQIGHLDDFKNIIFDNVVMTNDLKNGTLYYNDYGTPCIDENNYTGKIIFLSDVKDLKIAKTNSILYLKKMDITTGEWLETVTYDENAKNIQIINEHYNYVLAFINAPNLTLDDIQVSIHYNNIDNGRCENITVTNQALSIPQSNFVTDYFLNYSNTRLTTGHIKGNKINVKVFDDNIKFMVFAYKKSIGFSFMSDWVSSYSNYDVDIDYFVLMFKHNDGTDIDVAENNKFNIEYSLIKNDVEVVHFQTDCFVGDVIHKDNAILVLPKNYDRNGKSIRLCIVCHGSGATPYDEKTMDSDGKILSDPQRVLTKMGFAVLDVYGNPYTYSNSNDCLHFGNALSMQSYVHAYNYVIKNFNIRNDGLFLSGSSMGGLSAFNLINNTNLPILACTLYAPVIDFYKQAWCNPWTDINRERISNYFNFTGERPAFTTNYPPTSAEIDYFKNNVFQTIGFNPMTNGLTNGKYSNTYEVFTDTPTNESEEELAVYNELRNSIRVPLKIFHCKDDDVVAFKYSEYYINALKRNGQFAYIIPIETGGHNAWENGEDVVMNDIENNPFTCKPYQKQGFEWFRTFN